MKKIFKIFLWFIFLIFFVIPHTKAQIIYDNPEKGQRLQIFQAMQFWAVYQQLDKDRENESGNSRTDFFIRRARIGFRGSINQNTDFFVATAYDLLGKDHNTNFIKDLLAKSDDKTYQIWDAFLRFKINKNINLTTGLFRPQTSRESIRAAFGTMTFEKTLTNFVHRAYTTGKNPGRATGVNLSTLIEFAKPFKGGLKFDAGIFNAFENNTVSSHMYAGRIIFFVGENEKELRDNHFGKKNGIIVGFYSTYQPKVQQTALSNVLNFYNSVNPQIITPFNKNHTVEAISFGSDILLNYGALNIKAEYSEARYLNLMGTTIDALGHYGIKAYDVVLGYTTKKIWLGNIELTTSVSAAIPDKKITLADLQIVDLKYGYLYTRVNLFDFGINYYLNEEKFKISLHYVIVDEKPTDTSIKFYKNDFLGVGIQLMW